jgi:hypothetical protein
VNHWPALRLWQEAEYLRRKLTDPAADAVVPVHNTPYVQYPLHTRPRYFYNEKGFASCVIPVSEFIRTVTSDENGYYELHGWPITPSSSLAPMLTDLGEFPFVQNPRPGRVSPRYRAFIYRNSYTDWHFHPTDETLMCQLRGSKEVLLLPPDSRSYEILTEIVSQTERLYAVDTSQFPRYSELRPYRVIVEPGDALFIPTFWWHAVEPIGSRWGITVAYTWATPLYLFDPRMIAVRAILYRALLSASAPFFLTAACYSILRRSLGNLLRTPPYSI